MTGLRPVRLGTRLACGGHARQGAAYTLNRGLSLRETGPFCSGIDTTLKGEGPFTVFAPNDDAFAKLPAGTVEDLVKPENKAKLTAILTYHVMAGKVMAADISGKKLEPATVNGQTLHVDATSGVTVNGAAVVAADIDCTNGVIHVIDAVLMPTA